MLVAFAAIALYGVLAGATPLVVRAVLMGGFSVLGAQLGCCQTGQIVLVIGSGYAPLNTPEWIERWRPQVILLSVAAGDPNGRPDLGTLQALDGYTLLRTDQNGWIELSTDGEEMWVEVKRR